MTEPNLSLSSPSKRAKIRELTLAGLSPKAIVDKVGTSVQYVYKERGRLRADGFSITHQALTISTSQNKKELAGDESKNFFVEQKSYGSAVDQSTFYDIPPLEREDVRTMYQAFKNNENAADVVAEHGFHPIISHTEYIRYLDMTGHNPKELQKKLVSRINDDAPSIIVNLKEKSKSKLLSNNELMSIIEFLNERSSDFSLTRALSYPEFTLPEGLSRVVCSSCHQPQVGVAFDNRTDAGNYLVSWSRLYVCKSCRNRNQKFTES